MALICSSFRAISVCNDVGTTLYWKILMRFSEANLPMDDLWYAIGKRTVGLECGTPFGRNKSVLKKDVGVLFLVSRRLHTSER
jgi:hypothetical protein